MRQLVYLTSARDDLADILRHIAQESGDISVAQAFIAKLMARCDHLAELLGIIGTARPELRADIRSMPHQSYVIFFRYESERVEIVDVLHGGRDIGHQFTDEQIPPFPPIPKILYHRPISVLLSIIIIYLIIFQLKIQNKPRAITGFLISSNKSVRFSAQK